MLGFLVDQSLGQLNGWQIRCGVGQLLDVSCALPELSTQGLHN